MKYTLLIAEDNVDIVDTLMLYIGGNDFQVIHAADGQQALEELKDKKIDVVLVDVMMPKMDGYEFIREARKFSNIPIVILSAKNDDTDKVKGLNIGADAYLTKPFNPFEVVACLKAVLRRYYELGSAKFSENENHILTVGELELDVDSFILKKSGRAINLTSTEYKIIAKLMRNPGKVFTKNQLYDCINDGYTESDENTIMVHMSNIRSKIEDFPSNPEYIKTIRGLGYKIENR